MNKDERFKEFREKVMELANKYEVDVTAQLQFTPNGILPVLVVLDIHKEPETGLVDAAGNPIKSEPAPEEETKLETN